MLPVGIAQPMQSRELDQPVGEWEGKTRALWKEEGEGDETGAMETKPSHLSSDVEDEEAVQKVTNQLDTLSSSESTPSSDEEEEEDEDESLQPLPTPQYQSEPEDTHKSTTKDLRKLPPSSHEDLATTDLPPGRNHHVFVSHSTGDQAVVKNRIVVPLREMQGLKVVACYHCMEQSSQYNDKYIQRAMRESCVVVVGLSPSYLESQRCVAS